MMVSYTYLYSIQIVHSTFSSFVQAQDKSHVKELANRLANDHRHLHAAVSRIGKTIDKVLNERLELFN